MMAMTVEDLGDVLREQIRQLRDELDGRLESADGRMERIEARVEPVGPALAELRATMVSNHQQRQGEIGALFEQARTRVRREEFERLSAKVESQETRLTRAEMRLAMICTAIAAIVSTCGTLAANWIWRMIA
ncbi:MAG: hypothetical protein LC135_01890 [Phycisphaerae bacterium]|nr:hypothetical protein [Phycisphaerae bacterium]MCZ2398605.1 hypothetical protein [Phycisphaerae bacterium]